MELRGCNMPLTAELATPDSYLAGWIRSRLPHFEALQPAWTDALAGPARCGLAPTDRSTAWHRSRRCYRLGFARRLPALLRLCAVPTFTVTTPSATFEAHRDLPAEICADLRPLPGSRCLRAVHYRAWSSTSGSPEPLTRSPAFSPASPPTSTHDG